MYGREYTVRTLLQEDVVDVKVLNDILFPIKYGDNFYKLLTREANVSSSPSAARMVHPNTDKILTNGYWTILVFSDSDQMIDDDLSGCTSDVAGAKAPVGCSVRPCHRLVGASTFKGTVTIIF